MFTANLSGDDINLHANPFVTKGSQQSRVMFCEPLPSNPTRMLKDAVDAKGNVVEIEERINRKDFE
jgi:hypothetical protein